MIKMAKQYIADKLVELIRKHLSKKIPLFLTDGLKFYRETLLKQFGVLEEYPDTRKEEDQRNKRLFLQRI